MRKSISSFSVQSTLSLLTDRAVYPLDTVKTRLQALPSDQRQDHQTPSLTDVKPPKDVQEAKGVLRALLGRLKRWEMLQMLLRIIKTEGLAGVFKGFSANMINTFSQRESLTTTAEANLCAMCRTPHGRFKVFANNQNSHTFSSIPPFEPPS
jgi:hypothetical protein